MKAAIFANGLILTFLLSTVQALPKLFICSDSTTANYTSGLLQGWGFYTGRYLNITFSNQARNGRSTRTFIREGLWDTLLSGVIEGDFVLIEMGHNDDGDPVTEINDRATLIGIGNNSATVTTSTGGTEVVYSFGWYLRKMIVDVRAKGGIPILSGMVNRNYWNGDILQDNWTFASYTQQVAIQTAVEYIDHTKYCVKRWQSLGKIDSTAYYPSDSTHTSPGGADINAQNFVTAIKCQSTIRFPKSQLLPYLNAAGKAVNYAC